MPEPASSTVRLRPAPTYEPPYDDERPPDAWEAWIQPHLDLDLAGTLGSPQPAPAAGRASTSHDARPAAPDPATGHGARPPAPGPPTGTTNGTTGAGPPDRLIAVRFVNACLEILNGLRPAGHLRSLTPPGDADAVVSTMNRASRRLRRAIDIAGTPTSPDRLLKLHRLRVFGPRPGAIEIAAVVGTADRCWAAAFRLEQRQGRWLCTTADVL